MTMKYVYMRRIMIKSPICNRHDPERYIRRRGQIGNSPCYRTESSIMPHGKLIGLSPRASIFVPRYQEALRSHPVFCEGCELSLGLGLSV